MRQLCEWAGGTMTSKKLRLGPLPEQANDYSQYEETVIRWDRIGVMGGVALLVIGALGSWVWQGRVPQGQQGFVVASTEEQAQSDTSLPVVVEATAESATPEIKVPEVADVADVAALPPTSAGIPVTEAAPVLADVATSAPVEVAKEEILSPVSTLHHGLSRAELTMNMDGGEPGEPVGYRIQMNDEGIIKLILFTEMDGLRGKTLHHEWYRGDARVARVRIPVNVDQQRSHSSKFINRQMLGVWRVKVVDEQGELYAEANFEVVEG